MAPGHFALQRQVSKICAQSVQLLGALISRVREGIRRLGGLHSSQFSDRTKQTWARVGFVLVNVWLVYHLFAIVVAPWAVPPSSRLVQNCWRAVGPYVQALFLNHGHSFFAPQPDPSTLLGYVLEMPDGRRIEGRIPNRGIWPRLLYHRHFMLTEFLASPDARAPGVKDALVRAMAHELCREYGASKVTLSQVTHDLSSMERIRAGGKLDDPENYTEQPLDPVR